MISHRLLKSEEELKEIQERYEQQAQKKQEKQQIYEQLTDSIDSQARKELEEIDERIQELQTEIANAGGEEYVEMKERYEEFKSQFDAKLEIMGKAKSMQEVGKNQLEKISVDIEENKSKIAEKQELIQQLSEKSKELETDVEKLLLTQTELRKEKKEVDQEWKDESKLLEEVKEDMRKFKNEIETIQKAVDKIDAELSDFLRRQVDISKNVKGKFKTLKKNINDLNEILELNKLEDNIDQADDLDYAEAKEETKEDLEEHKENIKQEDMQVDGANQDSEEEIDTNRVDGSEGKRKKLYWPDLLKEDKKPDEFKLKISECIELASYIDEITQEFEEVDKEVDETEANFTVIDEYRKQMRSFRDANKILLNFKRKEKDIMEGLEQIKKKKYKKFMDGFTIIKEKLKEMYRFITGEGDAELDLKDSLDPFIEGVVFTVRPPKKSWKQISHLSGGEKTLASLSLIFALHHFKPTPIYCMDEIDAALDYRNVSIVASYVKRQACNAQFIVISLRQNMFEMSDKMVGIYKIKDVTRTVCIAPRLFEKNLIENGSIPN